MYGQLPWHQVSTSHLCRRDAQSPALPLLLSRIYTYVYILYIYIYMYVYGGIAGIHKDSGVCVCVERERERVYR